MEKNPRSELQEYFQKQGLPIPKYNYFRQGGTDHSPIWRCEIFISDGLRFMSDDCTSKQEAGNHAAKKALDLSTKVVEPLFEVSQNPIKCMEDIINITKTAVIVDVENMQKFIDEIGIKANKYTVFAFVGEHHSLANKVYSNKVNVVHSSSTRKDGTDIHINTFVGFLLSKDIFDEYIIVTRDHFGHALVETIQSENSPWKAKKARVITNASKLD